MRLSVLIVNYNAGAFLERCLASLRAHLSEIPHEVCLVDNASSDGSLVRVRARFPGVQIIENSKNLGFAAAINQGLRETTGTYVLWLNPDTELLDSGFLTLLNYLDVNPTLGVLGPQLINPDGRRQLSCRSFPSYRTAFFHRYALLTRLLPSNPFSKKYLHTDWGTDRIRETDWVSGACLLHRRAVSDKLGGLDELFFMYCEDVDFCLRARQAGWSTGYHPDARALHHIGTSSQQLARRMILERHRSMWRYYRKHFHPNWAKVLVVGPAIATRCAFLLAQNALFGKRSTVLR